MRFMQIWLSGCWFFFFFLKREIMLSKWSALGHLRLADFGLSRRLERGGRAFTICGTIQYMGEMSQHHLHSYLHVKWICCTLTFKWTWWWGVHPVLWACSLCSAAPEVLSGGPYNHAADWWSLGILLFSLVTGKVRSLLLLSWRTVSFKSVWRVFFFKAILMQQKMKAELIIAESF